jgi:hypothetical protein
MTPQTKKGLIITAVVGVLIFVAVKTMAKKPTTLANPNTPPSGNINNPTDATNNSGGVFAPPTNDVSIVGKVATAKTDNVYVRKDADEYANLVYNNIVGVLKNGETAGTVSASSIGTDGKLWYSVDRGAEYNCDFATCGIHLSNNSGWVKSSEVNLF